MGIMKAHEHPDVTTHWKGLIWPEALDVPFQCFVRQILKEPTAAFLDEALTNIAHARAPLLRQIGRRLSKIRDKDLFAVLGKSSFKDYVAERLELGCRSAQEMARTAEALERLPLLRQASDESLVTSCHVRDLVRVVTPETEAEWVEKAVKVTVRGLRVEILRQIEAGKLPEDAKPETDDDSVKVSFEAPPWFRSKLDTAVDLFRKLEGFAGASRASAAEAMAAEWLSGAPLPGAAETATDGARPGGEPCGREDHAAVGSPAEPTGPLVPAAKCGSAAATPTVPPRACRPGEENLDPIHRAALERGRLHGATIVAFIDGQRVENPERGVWEEYRQRMLEEDFDRWKYLDDQRESPTLLPAWIKTYEGTLSDDPFTLDRDLRSLEYARRELDGMTGRILLTMGRLALFKAMGFKGIGHYARERLGMPSSTARRLERIERLMFELPEVRDSFYSGEIGLAKVDLLLRVWKSRQMDKWMDRARNVTVRRLEMEVQAVLRRNDLTVSGLMAGNLRKALDVLVEGADLRRYMSALDQIARQAGNRETAGKKTTVTVSFRMEPDAAEAWKASVEHCRAIEGLNLADWEVTDRFLDAFFAEYDRVDPLRYALNHKVFARDGCPSTLRLAQGFQQAQKLRDVHGTRLHSARQTPLSPH